MKPFRELQTALFERVNPLVNFSVTRYVLSVAIFVGVVVFGFLSMRSLGVSQLPSISIPIVAVETDYTGATPEIVDKNVTQVVEDAVAGIEGVTGIDSTSSSGSSRVVLTFNQGTDSNANVNKVASAVSGLRGLPDGVDSPSVRTFDPNSAPVVEFGVSSDTATVEDIYQYVNDVMTPALQRLGGVASITVSGGAERQFQVLLNPDRLAASNLTPAKVTSAITSADVFDSIGSITRNGTTVDFTTQNTPTSVADINRIVVDTAKNVHVSDLGVVKDSSSATSYTRVNGTPVVLVSIQQTSGSNAVAVADNVQGYLKGATLPQGYKVTVSNDTTGPVRSAIHSTERELYTTALVVAVIVLLFLGRVNTAFSVIFAIPISLAAAPILYNLMGFTFNQVSLLAMIVAIGIVVDDSIVVAENIERHREMGLDRFQAVLRGGSEVFSAVAAASLSLLAVLIPVSFVGGFIGAYLQQFALGLAAAVLLSWLEALLFLTVRMAYTPDARALTWRDVPGAAARLIPAVRQGFRWLRNFWVVVGGVILTGVIWKVAGLVYVPLILLYPVALGLVSYLFTLGLTLLEALSVSLNGLTEGVVNFVRDAYANSLHSVLRNAVLTLGLAFAFLAVTFVWIVPKLTFQFTPQSDNGTLTARMRMPSGTSLSSANVYAARLENYLLARKEVETVQTSVSEDDASLAVTLVDRSGRGSVFDLIGTYQAAAQGLYADQPGIRAFISAGGGFQGGGSSVNLNFVSASRTVLDERVQRALTLLEQNPDVSSVRDSAGSTRLQKNFVTDPSSLARAGLTVQDVSSVLKGYASGANAGTVTVGGLSYDIEVEVDSTLR